MAAKKTRPRRIRIFVIDAEAATRRAEKRASGRKPRPPTAKERREILQSLEWILARPVRRRKRSRK